MIGIVVQLATHFGLWIQASVRSLGVWNIRGRGKAHGRVPCEFWCQSREGHVSGLFYAPCRVLLALQTGRWVLTWGRDRYFSPVSMFSLFPVLTTRSPFPPFLVVSGVRLDYEPGLSPHLSCACSCVRKGRGNGAEVKLGDVADSWLRWGLGCWVFWEVFIVSSQRPMWMNGCRHESWLTGNSAFGSNRNGKKWLLDWRIVSQACL